MFVMDGLEVMMCICEFDFVKFVVFIVGVFFGVEGMSEKECRDVGMNDFVFKLLNVWKLIDVICKMLFEFFVEDLVLKDERIWFIKM